MKSEVHNFRRKVAIKIAAYTFINLLAECSISLIAQVIRLSPKLKFCCNMQHTNFRVLTSAIKVSMIGR